MSDTNKPARSMSSAEAQQEHDDIQREIAESKGLKYEPEDKAPKAGEGEDGEPGKPDPTPEPKKADDPEKGKEKGEDDDQEDVDSQDDQPGKPRKPSLLGKYQTEKAARVAAEDALAKKDAEIAKLTEDLNRTKTVDQLKDKVKAYAEKHSMTEEAAMDLVLLTKDAIQPDADTRKIIEESRALIVKDKAEKQFETEFSDLIADEPDAAQKREEIRQAAYLKENLNRSLYEVFHRLKASEPVKKKTGEASRGAPGREVSRDTFSVEAVAERVKSGVADPFKGCTTDQIDKVFSYLDKQGSRYIKS